MSDTTFQEVQTIGEASALVRFHGIKPEYIDPDHPDEVYAYLTLQGREADVAIPMGPKGEPGLDGEPAQPFRWQTAVETRANLPEYLSGDDTGKSWIVNDEKALVYWDGNQYITISDVLVPGPRGPRGLQGLRGTEGKQGKVGPTGPAAAISASTDYDKSATIGDTLVYGANGQWTSTPVGGTKHYVIPQGSLDSAQKGILDGSADFTMATVTIPPQGQDFTVGVRGAMMIDSSLGIAITGEVLVDNVLVGVGHGDQFTTTGNRLISSPEIINIVTTAPEFISPDNDSAGVFKGGETHTVTVRVRRSGLFGEWSVDGRKSNIELTLHPVVGW